MPNFNYFTIGLGKKEKPNSFWTFPPVIDWSKIFSARIILILVSIYASGCTSWTGQTHTENCKSIEILSSNTSAHPTNRPRLLLRFSTETQTYYAGTNSYIPTPGDLDKCKSLTQERKNPALVAVTVHTLETQHIWQKGKEIYRPVTTLTFYTDLNHRENNQETFILAKFAGDFSQMAELGYTQPVIVKKIDVNIPVIFEEKFVKEPLLPSSGGP